MREFVIKQWNALGYGKDQEPAPEEPSPPVSSREPKPSAPKPASASTSISIDEIPKPRSAPAEDAPQRVEARALPASPRAAAAPPRAGRRRGERNFVVAYDGRFVGVFEAEEELTPREAFVRVAGDLSCRKDFDPEKVQLYKPVLLRSARPPKGAKFVSGKLTEIGGRIHGGRDKEAASAPPGPPEAQEVPEASEDPVEEKACLELA